MRKFSLPFPCFSALRGDWAESEQAVAGGDGRGLAPVAGAEFGEDAGNVAGGGLAADEEAFRNLDIRQPLAKKREHILLAISEDRRHIGVRGPRDEPTQDATLMVPVGVEAIQLSACSREGIER